MHWTFKLVLISAIFTILAIAWALLDIVMIKQRIKRLKIK